MVTRGQTVPLRLFVSACLLSHVHQPTPVAYHGRASVRKQSSDVFHPVSFLVDTLGVDYGIIETVTLCPEMDVMSLPSPRSPLKLVAAQPTTSLNSCQPEGLSSITSARERSFRLCSTACGTDMTLEMCGKAAPDVVRLLRVVTRRGTVPFNDSQNTGLGSEETSTLERMLDGGVMKSRSPSCGVGDARLYSSATPSNSDAYLPTDGAFVKTYLRSFESGTQTDGHRARLSLPLVTERTLRPRAISGGGHATEAVEAFLKACVNRYGQRHEEVELSAASSTSGAHR